MKTLKIFTVVLGIHLLAIPLVILQISREPNSHRRYSNCDEIADLDSVKRVENAAVLPLMTTIPWPFPKVKTHQP